MNKSINIKNELHFTKLNNSKRFGSLFLINSYTNLFNLYLNCCYNLFFKNFSTPLFKRIAVAFLFLFCFATLAFCQNEKKGFTSLFVNSAYDTSKPYAAQLNPKAIPFVNDYINKQGAELERMKVWGKNYFKLYDGILRKYGIPTEMKYLSVIESHLQSNLVSWAGAVGPWQIMDYEATRFGLKLYPKDERMDYIKSTHVACKLMKELYREFNDWLLVVAAYNGGAGRVRGAIKKSGSRDFWDLQNFLLDETKNHVKKFIATHYLFEGKAKIENHNNEELAFKADSINKNTIDTIIISGKYNDKIVCKYLQIDGNLFAKMNPNFNSDLASGKKYPLKIIRSKVGDFYSNKYSILQESIKQLLETK